MRYSFVFLMVFSFISLANSAEMGKFSYGDFYPPKRCRACHREIYQEWQESLMAKSFVHKWDDVEYFKLALPQALKLKKVADVKSGCVACHSPLAFLTGDIPPQPPEEDTRANEGVSCEVCHSIVDSTEKEPFNFSFIVKPGKTKFGPRKDGHSSFHKTQYLEFTTTPKLCATCHNEQSPYGAWVKETYQEWKNSPYAKGGIRCQDCHMYRYKGKAALGGKPRKDIAHHVFHGAHFRNKLAGAVDIVLYSPKKQVMPGSDLNVRVELFNGKVGHYIPSGSSEERMLWLEVKAIDAQGKTYFLKVKPKGFAGEEYTISDPDTLAYQAMGEIMGIKGFKGVKRDGNLPKGVRIFRRPFFDPKGRMTICQWYTARNTLVDYRIGPQETKTENYTLTLPRDVASGKLTIKATLYYSLVPSSVGEFLHLPPSEYAPIKVNTTQMYMEVKNDKEVAGL